jgi:hypothetical protein
MAKLVFGMNQPLDGYVDHTAFANTESTCTPSSLVAGSHISPARGHRSALSLMIELAKT